MSTAVIPDAHRTIRFVVTAATIVAGLWVVLSFTDQACERKARLDETTCATHLAQCQAATATAAGRAARTAGSRW